MPQKYLNSKLIKIILAGFFCVLLIFFSPKKIIDPFRYFFVWATYPIQKTFATLGGGTAQALHFLSSISDLKKENEKLVKENYVLSGKIASLESQKRENEDLRQELKLSPQEKFDLEGAFVIGQNPDNLGSWILVDKGKADGIKKGMPTIVFEGILIGKVDEVFQNSAKITLLSDANSLINAYDAETGAKGIVKGEYGLGLFLDMVDQSEALGLGETVATSGLGGNIPKGLLIGKIQEIKNSEDKLFQRALIIPSVKYSNLETVFIIKNKK
jgi:rod shape-determining protein MreC